jgi:hypothetical protein
VNTQVNTPVSVSFVSDAKTNRVYPGLITWNGRVYRVLKVGLHHTFQEGRVLYHVFSVVTATLFMKLILNSENLHWRLEEIANNLPD